MPESLSHFSENAKNRDNAHPPPLVQLTMLPQCSVLGTISGNRAFNHQLSPYQRGKIVGLTARGEKSRSIEDLLKVSRGAVRSTIQLDHVRHEGNPQVRSGRPKEYSEATIRKIIRHVRLQLKDSYAELIRACDLSIKRTTIKSILSQHGITNWRARRRPLLTEANVAKRLAWCLEHRYWTKEEWGLYMWSDECSVERGRGKRAEWVFRTSNQAWDRKMIQEYDCKKNMKVMVWGCFWDTGRSSLYIMDRDFESAKHGYSAESYLEVLEAELAPIYSALPPGYVFMQDNASIHTAHKVREWFRDHGVENVTSWPPYSPDLNPIEHIWWELKKRLYEMFPDIARDKSESEYSRQRLESALQATWDTLDKSQFDCLYESMPSRIEACIAADGWHTRY